MSATKSFLLLILIVFGLTACDNGPANLAPDKRPIPAELASEQRESFRKLPFKAAHNFRDLGGYKTTDGRQTKWGMLYRSDTLSELTHDDTMYLERLGLKRIVDFRSKEEQLAAPDIIAANSAINIERMPIAVSGANLEFLTNKISSGNFTKQEMSQLVVNANREFVEKYTLLYR
ncbi:MAG TPA: tyrosine-protein phosphatase, partial [Porticoccus sp.]|nr:tyrosine-protein phosphatase [Porticoccus sp.]